MDVDPANKEYVLDDHDRSMLAVDWEIVPLNDAHILLAANRALQARSAEWAATVQGAGDLAEASAERDIDYSRIYGRNLLNLIHQHRRRAPGKQ